MKTLTNKILALLILLIIAYGVASVREDSIVATGSTTVLPSSQITAEEL